MGGFTVGPVQNTLAVLILIARIGDIGSTYLATPSLALESNPIMRFGGWRLALLTVVACLIPYFSAPLGLTMLVLSLLVTGSNLSKGWLMRSLGEEGYQAMVATAARRSSLAVSLAFTLGSAAAFAAAGFVMMYVSGGAGTWAYWASTGVMLFGLALGVYGSLSAIRVFRRVTAKPADAGERPGA